MNKQSIFLGLIAALVLIGVALYFLLPDDMAISQLPQESVFYYGDTCPHCEKVEEYVEQNNVREKVAFADKEVYNNAENASELRAVAKACDIAPQEIGVPLLWAEERCIIGDQDIIEYFKQRIESQQ